MTATTTDFDLEDEVLPQTVEEIYALHAETAQKVAAREHRKAPSFSVDDMEQAIWEHILTNKEHYFGKTADRIEEFMSKAAKQFWSRERIDFMYFTGNFVYRPQDVRRALEACAWVESEQCPDVDAKLDVRTAFKYLAPQQAKAVFKRYGEKVPHSELSSTEKSNLSYGVENMTHRLNDGLRKKPSNLDDLKEVS